MAQDLQNSHEIPTRAYLLADECPITQFMLLLGGKWKPIIICLLSKHGVLRFGELHHAIEGISEKVLAGQLKELETAEIVARTTYPEVPPKVEYTLTEKGHSLKPLFAEILAWSEMYIV